MLYVHACCGFLDNKTYACTHKKYAYDVLMCEILCIASCGSLAIGMGIQYVGMCLSVSLLFSLLACLHDYSSFRVSVGRMCSVCVHI